MILRFSILVTLFLLPGPSVLVQEKPNSVSDRYSKTLQTLFDGNKAYSTAGFFTRFWRIGGGPGFDTCVTYLEHELRRIGFQRDIKTAAANRYFIEEDMPARDVWTPHDAILSLELPEQRVLHTFQQTPLLLCHNSFPTDITAPLVFVQGGGEVQDYDQISVTGSTVLCSDPAASAYELAMSRGARGVISFHVPPHNLPDQHPDIIAEGSIPYDTTRKAFGLQIHRRLADELRSMLAYQQVNVRVQIKASFDRTPVKTLVAEIPGTSRPEERIVLVAHLDHYQPGANDNASGSATLLEILRSIATGIASGTLERPARTLTFLWVDEYQGTGFWMGRHSKALDNVQAAFVLDMVGGDPQKTGGIFRVERMPDPSAIWFRYPDQHSGWGTGSWEREKLFGSYLNDFYLSIVQERADATGWRTTQNVWEGGSDHDPFLRKGIPAILSWHFPDFGYHSSMDVMDNISPVEMSHAGVSVGTAAFMLALGSEPVAHQVLDAVVAGSIQRLKGLEELALLELSEGQVQGSEMLAAVKRQEKEIIQAWSDWYRQAIESVGSIPANQPQPEFSAYLNRMVEEHQQRYANLVIALGL